MNEKSPWWVARRMSPSQVWEWLQKNDKRNLSFIPDQVWYRFLERKKRSELRRAKTNTDVQCPKCGSYLQIFLVPKRRLTIVAQNQDEANKRMVEISKLISGFYCHTCGRSYFAKDFNEDMVTEMSRPSWLLGFVKEITKEETRKEEVERTEPRKGLEKWF